ncbi:MAG: hypothetical protein ABIM40_09155 [Pseudomonadota bacterium]
MQVHADTRPDIAGLQDSMTAVKDVPAGVPLAARVLKRGCPG